jgi:hypothetical protein
MLLKWIFNALLFLWLYHAVVKPLFIGYFYGNKGTGAPRQPDQRGHQKPTTKSGAKRRNYNDEGDYVDYEEVDDRRK